MIGKLTVLGAGYMGSAICCPLSESAENINLWGTWLDDDLLDAAGNGEHPRIKKILPANVRLYRSHELAESLRGTDLVIIAVSSEGFAPVFDRFLSENIGGIPVLTVTKGFIDESGTVERISSYAERLYRRRFSGDAFRWGSIGGPVKAVELADKIPTHSIYGLKKEFPEELISGISNSYYRVSFTDDVIGVETCSALKNAYAIALGICDGAYGGSGGYYDNIKAFFLSAAVHEMALITSLAGGRTSTANYLAGTGDLYVTAQSGRNKVFGSHIGEGIVPEVALDRMNKAGDIAEGYHSLKYGKSFIEGLGKNPEKDFPLFSMLHSVIFSGINFEDAIRDFISGTGRREHE